MAPVRLRPVPLTCKLPAEIGISCNKGPHCSTLMKLKLRIRTSSNTGPHSCTAHCVHPYWTGPSFFALKLSLLFDALVSQGLLLFYVDCDHVT